MTTARELPDQPLRRDAERNRQRILNAARTVFADEGLGASVDDIARHAGVGVGTVYRRYPNKQSLIDALFEDRLAGVVAVLDEGVANPDPWAGLAGALERVAELQAEDRGLMELLIGDAHRSDMVGECHGQLESLAEALTVGAQHDGSLRADAAPTDMGLIMLVLGLLTKVVGDVQPEVWRRFLAIALDGLRAEAARVPLRGPLTAEQFVAVKRSLHD